MNKDKDTVRSFLIQHCTSAGMRFYEAALLWLQLELPLNDSSSSTLCQLAPSFHNVRIGEQSGAETPSITKRERFLSV
jgi:hypothetical protein